MKGVFHLRVVPSCDIVRNILLNIVFAYLSQKRERGRVRDGSKDRQNTRWRNKKTEFDFFYFTTPPTKMFIFK